jgi:hypothetical protein
MLKRLLPLLSCLLLLAGCASRYTVVMSNGMETTAKGKPQLIEEITIKDKTGKSQKVPVNPHYYFKDVSGKEVRIPVARVHRIFPTSDKEDESTYYLPNDYQMPPDTRPWYKRL